MHHVSPVILYTVAINKKYGISNDLISCCYSTFYSIIESIEFPHSCRFEFEGLVLLILVVVTSDHVIVVFLY